MCEPRAAGGNILHATLAERASLRCVKERHRIDFLARKSPLVGGHCSGLESKAPVGSRKRHRLGSKVIANAESAAIVMRIRRLRETPKSLDFGRVALSHGVAILGPGDFGDHFLKDGIRERLIILG